MFLPAVSYTHLVVVRTLDIGGDKKLPYFTFDPEMNPFLGYRAIRLCLDRTEIFRTQLRALIRASVYGRLCIMFPMIATVDELSLIHISVYLDSIIQRKTNRNFKNSGLCAKIMA